DRRVQCLHAAVEDLWKTGVVLDRAGVDARRRELGRGPTRRDDLDAELAERAREVNHAALVEDGQKCPLDLQLAELGRGLERRRGPTVAHLRPPWVRRAARAAGSRDRSSLRLLRSTGSPGAG